MQNLHSSTPRPESKQKFQGVCFPFGDVIFANRKEQRHMTGASLAIAECLPKGMKRKRLKNHIQPKGCTMRVGIVHCLENKCMCNHTPKRKGLRCRLCRGTKRMQKQPLPQIVTIKVQCCSPLFDDKYNVA